MTKRRFLTAFVLANILQGAAFGQAGCNTPPVWKPSEERVPLYSVARVFGDANGASPKGAATVIDARRGLLITASHVVEGETAWFRFPGFDSAMLRGKVLLRLPAADGEDEDNGNAWAKARDIAILQAEKPLPTLARPLDLRVALSDYEPLTFYGFPTLAMTAVFGEGRAGMPSPARPLRPFSESDAACTRVLREITQPGDSGSAVVARNAYVVGVTSKSVQRERQNLFIPTSCFFDAIATKIDPASTDETYRLFTTGSKTAIAAWLADEPSRLSNIDIYLAVTKMLEKDVAIDRLQCPIASMASERGIPLDGLILRARTKGQKLALADGIFGDIVRNGVARDTMASNAALRVARTLYTAAIAQTTGGLAPSTPAAVRELFDMGDARMLKSYSDISLLLAGQSPEESALLYKQAKAAAALSVLSSGGNATLRGAAYASLGQAGQRSEDLDLAIAAFTAAQKNGFSPVWVQKRRATLLNDVGAGPAVQKPDLQNVLATTATTIFQPTAPF